MSQPISQRIGYHPDPLNKSSSNRSVNKRLQTITSNINFTNKIVLDLGCSGGFFTFSLASLAKKIIAVDGDEEIIKRNKEYQKKLGIKNIEFIHANISKELIDSLEDIDITLFLSVYHHMLTHSNAYDWNLKQDSIKNEQFLKELRKKTNIFIFEIGLPNEGYEWCELLPDFGLNWDEYIKTTIFKKDFPKISTYQPIKKSGLLHTFISHKLSFNYKEDSRLIQKIKRIFKFDSRDFRKIYIGKKQ